MLFFCGTLLRDDNKTLRECNIENLDCVAIVFRFPRWEKNNVFSIAADFQYELFSKKIIEPFFFENKNAPKFEFKKKTTNTLTGAGTARPDLFLVQLFIHNNGR